MDSHRAIAAARTSAALVLVVMLQACDGSVWPAPMSWFASLNGVKPEGAVFIAEGPLAATDFESIAGVTQVVDAETEEQTAVRIAVFESTDAIDEFLASPGGAALAAARGRGVWAYALVNRLRADVADDQLPLKPPGASLLWMRGMQSHLSQRELGARKREREATFRTLEGLLQKFYLFDAHGDTIAGLYFWGTREERQAYVKSDFALQIPSAYDLRNGPETVYLEAR